MTKNKHIEFYFRSQLADRLAARKRFPRGSRARLYLNGLVRESIFGIRNGMTYRRAMEIDRSIERASQGLD